MSEKRFRAEVDAKGHLKIITDGETVLNDSYEVVDLLNEQETIIKELQDLYGESDYENTKLRLRNKKLQDKIDWLCEKYDYPNNKGVKNE